MSVSELKGITELIEKYGNDSYKEGFKVGVKQGNEDGYQRRQDELDSRARVLKRIAERPE